MDVKYILGHTTYTSMKIRVCITIDTEVWKRAKEVAGLIPMSRWVENLIAKDIELIK